MTKIQIITGSTRPGSFNPQPVEWIAGLASQREDIEVEIVDINDYSLPLLDEPVTPMMHQYSKDHTIKWADKIAEADGFIFVTPEYNHSTSAALKNAIDYLNLEWNNKAAGFVSYGSAGGVRAVEHLRGICAELHIATVRDQVMFSPTNGFVNYSNLEANEDHVASANKMLDQLTAWAGALKSVREPALQAA
jgi:NAD(P)H-dependent FMN reductase